MHHWPETNESLILRVKDPADAASWSDFLSIYRPVVIRMACGRGLQHADADAGRRNDSAGAQRKSSRSHALGEQRDSK
jgi:hypothetical protein